MKRALGSVVGLMALVLLVLAPTWFFDDGRADSAPDETTITDYVADFTLDEDGDLTVLETLTVDFPRPGKHGIFRFFDRADSSAPHARRTPRDLTVSMDGAPVEWERLEEDHGRYVVARIGDPDRTVTPGAHVYRIGYAIDGVLEPGTATSSQLYWNLVPGGWQQRIEHADLTVHLPVPASGVQCAVGAGADGGCEAVGDGTRELHVEVADLAPNTPVTVRAGLDLPTPEAGESLPWSASYDPVLGESPALLVVVLALALLAGAGGWWLARRTHERDPSFPLVYAPPPGVGPAQAAYLLEEEVDEETFVATLMYAAEHGALELDKAGDAWAITDKAGAEGWAGLDPVTREVAGLLAGPGTSFTAARHDVAAGKRLKAELEDFTRRTGSWAQESGLMATSGLGAGNQVLVGAALLAVAGVVIWNPFSMTALALVPGAFAVLGLPLLRKGSGTRRTRAGRRLWSEVGGFRRILATPSSVERFEFSGREELYTRYIPWAVAFGCADEWAEKYRTEMAAEPPQPSYLAPAHAGVHAGSTARTLVEDFGSTLDGAVSAYEATQRSSSSGGGGFSGGGGGGGGGGGSW